MEKTPYNTVSDLIEGHKNQIVREEERHPITNFIKVIGKRPKNISDVDHKRVMALLDEWYEHQDYIEANSNDANKIFGRDTEQEEIILVIKGIYDSYKKK